MDPREASDREHASRSRRKRGFSSLDRRNTNLRQLENMQYEHSFHYKPLDRSKGAVRLIKVYQLQEDERIRCRIERHHISNTRYTALSYVWGSGSTRHTILLNGQIFLVRSNLYAFLYHVAKNKHFAETLFWIDAISINQSDISEKNGHVQHMGAIYSNASRVIAWLGHSSGSLVIRAKPPNRWICCNESNQNNETSRRHTCDWRVPARSSWEVVMHPYWSRLWIAQELGLASRVDVLWRGRFYNWFRLRKHLASNIARQIQPKLEVNTQKRPFRVNLEYIKNLPIARYFNRAEAEPLGNLIPRFALHDCQIGHDHAYALLSLASDGGAFEPDYNESCISLLLRLTTFCYSHPTANFIGKIGSALGLDPISKGVVVDFVGRPQIVDQLMEVRGIYYRPIDHCSETSLNASTDIVVRFSDTNLHFMFRALAVGLGNTASKSYGFLSRIDAVSSRVEQAKHKFGRRSKKDSDNSWTQRQVTEHFQHMVLRGDQSTGDQSTGDLRLYCSWQSVLAIFELSETEAARGRLESRIRSWAGVTERTGEQRQAFTT